ncbi:MAG TPA: Dam family site-specific DNA-(adenine-N6)-methyltransferase [Coleofasciculaceae cyanobacterium]
MLTLEATEKTTLTPLLKWAGGNRKLAPAIAKFYEPFRATHAWCEPFVGGMGATLGVMPSVAILNDSNPHLINFYEWVQEGLDPSEWDIDLIYDRQIYEENRDFFNLLISKDRAIGPSAALLFYYLNRSCFNGLCRFNSSGGFNVPFGKYKTVNYRQDFSQHQEVFKKWEFTSGDFEKLTWKVCDRPTFTYCDPPYDCPFVSYSKGGFNWDDQVRLAEWCASLPGPVLVSNAATERVIELYGKLGFQVETFPVGRSISCNGDRTPVLEIFASKNMR